jgi:hypothetical protein
MDAHDEQTGPRAWRIARARKERTPSRSSRAAAPPDPPAVAGPLAVAEPPAYPSRSESASRVSPLVSLMNRRTKKMEMNAKAVYTP